MDAYAVIITLLGMVWSTRFTLLWWRFRKRNGSDPAALAHCLFFGVLAAIFAVLLIQMFVPAFVLPRLAIRTALVLALAVLEWNVRGRLL